VTEPAPLRDAAAIPPGGRRGRLPRSARRAQLLDAALEVFVASGYHAAAMDEIADRAGVSKPVLYQHFPGKLELYLALLDASCDAVVQGVRDALAATDDNTERVAATMQAFYTYVANEKAAFRLVFESDLTSERAVRERVDRVTSANAAAIAEVIREDTGLPEAQSELLAVSLVGMAQVSARYLVSSDHPVEPDEAVRLVSTLAWRGISGYPRHETGAGMDLVAGTDAGSG
jgi:AcrR family transcriptional regulator